MDNETGPDPEGVVRTAADEEALEPSDPVVAARPPAPPPPDPTGVPGVDAALDQLSALEQRPVDGHVEVYDEVQRRLHDALAELDDEQ